MLNCLVGSGNTSGRFVTHLDTGFLFPSLDCVAHHERSFRRSVHSDLTGRGLDEIASGSHGEDRSFPDILRRVEHSGLENDFEVLVSANGFEFAYFVEALLIVALQELTYGKHDVDLSSSGFESHSGLCDLDLQEGLRRRKAAADTSDVELRIFERFANVFRHSGINADSSYVGYTREFLLEGIDSVRHLLYFGDRIVGAEGGVVNLVKTFFPHLDVIILRKMLCFDVSYLSFHLLIGKRAGVLRE